MNINKYICLTNIQRLPEGARFFMAKEYITFLKTFAPSDKYPRLLDIGCGDGQELNLLSAEGYITKGITFSNQVIKEPHIYIMDMADIQFLPESFDIIYSCSTMEHCYIPWLTCLEIWITLRTDGIFFMAVPIPNMYKVITHPNLLSQEQWEFILSHVGFQLIYNEIHSFNNIPTITIVAKKSKPLTEVMQDVLNKLIKIREKQLKGKNVAAI